MNALTYDQRRQVEELLEPDEPEEGQEPAERRL